MVVALHNDLAPDMIGAGFGCAQKALADFPTRPSRYCAAPFTLTRRAAPVRTTP
jgi:hypothetical protein